MQMTHSLRFVFRQAEEEDLRGDGPLIPREVTPPAMKAPSFNPWNLKKKWYPLVSSTFAFATN
jgi:hypothetical protein